jgi:hypothetical protein
VGLKIIIHQVKTYNLWDYKLCSYVPEIEGNIEKTLLIYFIDLNVAKGRSQARVKTEGDWLIC